MSDIPRTSMRAPEGCARQNLETLIVPSTFISGALMLVLGMSLIFAGGYEV
jgi:hypothetical protein